MANVGNVYVDFTAETAKFTTGVDANTRKLGEFGEKAKEAKEKSEGIFGSIVGGELLAHQIEKVGDAAIEAEKWLAEMTEQTAKETAQLARMAETMDLSTQALQGLRAAATMRDIDAGAMDKGIMRLSSSIGEAALKAGPLRDTFEKLGLDVQKLADTSADEQMKEVADALKKIDNISERMATGKEIFGAREFRELAPILAEGSEGLEGAAEHARELGLVLNSADAAKLIEINETLHEQEERVKGLSNQWAAEIGDVDTLWTKFKIGLMGGTVEGARGMALALKDNAYSALNGLNEVTFGLFNDQIEAMNKKAADAKEKALTGTGKFDPTSVTTGIAYYTELEKKLRDVQRAQEEALNVSGGTEGEKQVAKLVDEYTRAGHAIPAEILKIGDHIKALSQQHDIEKMAAEAQKAIETLGMNEAEKKLYDLGLAFQNLDPSLQPALKALKETEARLADLEKHQAIGKKIHDLMVEVNAGSDEHAKKLAGLGEGATQDEIDRYDHLLTAQEKAKQSQKDLEEAKRMAEQSLSPAEKYNEEITKLNDLLRDGAINHKVYNQAKLEADKTYFKGVADAEKEADKSASAMVRRFDFKLPVGALAQLPKVPQPGAGYGPGDNSGDAGGGGDSASRGKGGKGKGGGGKLFVGDKVELPPLQLEQKTQTVLEQIRDNIGPTPINIDRF